MTTLRPKDRDLAFFSRITRRVLSWVLALWASRAALVSPRHLQRRLITRSALRPFHWKSHRKIIKTTGYNGTVPGPALRLQEGKPVIINVINDFGIPILSTGMGSIIPSNADGATEEGSPIIPPGESLLHAFTPSLLARAGTTATPWL